jgi:YD repeat-containing protein
VASAQAENHFRFDPVGQLIEERTLAKINEAKQNPVPLPHDYEAPATEYAFCLEHQYDELGNRIQTTLPNGRKIDTLRYGSGHWHGMLWQGQSVVDVERDGLHREISRSMGAHLKMQRSYDNQSRLESFRFERKFYEGSKLTTPGLQQRKYFYDETGNLIHIADTRRGNHYYHYDPLGQLLEAVQPGVSETFAFDPAGNLLDPPIERRRYPRPEFVEKPIPKVTYNLLKKYLGNVYEYDIQGNTIAKHPVRLSPGSGHIEQNQQYRTPSKLSS